MHSPPPPVCGHSMHVCLLTRMWGGCECMWGPKVDIGRHLESLCTVLIEAGCLIQTQSSLRQLSWIDSSSQGSPSSSSLSVPSKSAGMTSGPAFLWVLGMRAQVSLHDSESGTLSTELPPLTPSWLYVLCSSFGPNLEPQKVKHPTCHSHKTKIKQTQHTAKNSTGRQRNKGMQLELGPEQKYKQFSSGFVLCDS